MGSSWDNLVQTALIIVCWVIQVGGASENRKALASGNAWVDANKLKKLCSPQNSHSIKKRNCVIIQQSFLLPT